VIAIVRRKAGACDYVIAQSVERLNHDKELADEVIKASYMRNVPKR